jgi:hypothetical protein
MNMSVGGSAKRLITWFGRSAILPESSSSFSCFDRQ